MLAFWAILINCLWACSYPLSKMALKQVSPLVLTAWRMGITTLVFLPFIRQSLIPKKVEKFDYLLVVVMGLIGGIGATFLQYYGTNFTLTSNVSLMVTLETLVLVLLSAVFLKEALTKYTVISLLLALFGIILITVDTKSVNIFAGKYVYGNFIIFLSVVCYALYSVIGKVLIQRWSAVSLTFLPFLISTLVALPAIYFINENDFYMIFKLPTMPLSDILSALYLSVVATAFSYYLWNWLLNFVEAGVLGLSLYVQSVVGVLLSYLLFNERLTTEFFLGTLSIFIALAIDFKRIKTTT